MNRLIFVVLLGGCGVMSLLLWRAIRLKQVTIPPAQLISTAQPTNGISSGSVEVHLKPSIKSESVAKPPDHPTSVPARKIPYYEVEIAKPDFNELAQRSTCFLILQFHGKIDPRNPTVNGVPMLTEAARLEVLSASLGSGAVASRAFLAELLHDEREAATAYANFERELR